MCVRIKRTLYVRIHDIHCDYDIVINTCTSYTSTYVPIHHVMQDQDVR